MVLGTLDGEMRITSKMIIRFKRLYKLENKINIAEI